MIKAKIIGEGKDNRMQYLIIKKDKSFFDWLPLFLGRDLEKKRLRYGNIMESKDTHECHFTKEKVRVDIFYANEKIYLIFYTNEKNHKVIHERFDTIADFSEFRGD